MRLFFGIEIPDAEREKIEKIKYNIKIDGKIKWVEKENLHLTLLFLGEKNLIEVIGLLEKFRFEPFDVSLKGFGVFPDLKRPRVLWIGVEKGKEKMKELYEKLTMRLEPLNLEIEKRFFPHLTIGRIKFGNVNYEKLEYNSEIFHVDKFVLFSSTLTKSGPIYKKEKIFSSGG